MFERAIPIEFPGEEVPADEVEIELTETERGELRSELERIEAAEREAGAEAHRIFLE